MHTYPWQTKFNIDVPALDDEHRCLLDCINKLIIAQNQPKPMLLRLAKEVVAYAEFHFLSEENMMSLTHYPSLGEHAEQHKQLLSTLGEKYQMIEKDTDHLQDFVSFVVRWFIEHTQTVDRSFAKYLNDCHANLNAEEERILKFFTAKDTAKTKA